MRSSIRKLGFLLLPLLISACAGGGGGGGGSGGGGVVVTPFTSWSAIQPNTTVQAAGGSAGSNYTANTITGQVLSISTPAQASSGATINFTYGPTSLTGISIQSAQGASASLNTSAGDSIGVTSSGSIFYGENAAGTTTLLAPAVDYFGWNYQSYGVWITGQGTGSGSVGVASVGSITPVTGIPATGTGNFTGNTIGVFVDSSGIGFYTAGTMSATANFAAQTVQFATAGTVTVNLATGVSAAASNLNLNSNMTYAGGTISGPITSVSGMTGTASAKFFGPTAQEIGGTYVLQGSGASLVGGFGGAR
jgi:hypothetical protein